MNVLAMEDELENPTEREIKEYLSGNLCRCTAVSYTHLAQKEINEKRKAELIKIGDVCKKVPAYPPESFHEAIQFIWFVQVGGIICENPLSLNPGRFDQYMYPYYEKDIKEGKLDKDGALELIEALWIKYSE